MKILVLKTFSKLTFDIFFPQDVRQTLEALGEVQYLDYDKSPESKRMLLQQIKDVDVVFTGWGMNHFDKEILSAAQNLKIIAHTGGSVFELISAPLEEREDIVLLSGNRYFAESVAEATICYMLLGQRRLYLFLKEMEQDGWYTYRETAGLKGKTVGLVSFGMISQHVAKMLQAFDTKVKVYSGHEISAEDCQKYRIEVCTLEEVFRTSDIISVHSGLTDKTYHMVDKHLLSLMKDNALIINTSRGAVVDEAALTEELSCGRIRAVLDVFEKEPLSMDSGLRGLENVTLIPHRGGPTTDVGRLVTFGLIEDVRGYLNEAREPENRVSLQYAKRMTSHNLVEKLKKERVSCPK